MKSSSYSGQIAQQLQVYRSKAQKEGRSNRPPGTSAMPDQHEAELKSDAEGWLSSEQAIYDSTLTNVSKALTEAREKYSQLRHEYERILHDDTAISTVEAELAGDQPMLVKATEARLRAEAELNYFRESNGICEEAHYPESVIWHFGVLAVLALAEVIVNAFFFENSEGLLGGVVVACGIAVVNMGSALLLGIAFRQQNLRAVERKVAGWACVIAFIFIAVFCNALFASFRSEYQAVSDPSEAAQLATAFRRAWPEAVLIFKADMQFRDHWSFILFGVGIILSMWAFYKGYTMDDKFPGYSRKDRAYRIAKALEEREQERVRQKIKEMLHQRKAMVQAAMHEPSNQVGMLARRVAELSHAGGTLEMQAAAVRRDFALVLEAYRNSNAAVRSTESPAYFKTPTELTTAVSTDGGVHLSQQIASLEAELKELSDTSREHLNAKLNQLQDSMTELLTTTMTSFLADVLAEAEKNIARGMQAIHKVSVA